MKKIKQRNFVQEYSLLINHSTVFKDRKRAFKNGERKHKKKYFWVETFLNLFLIFVIIKFCYVNIKNILKKIVYFLKFLDIGHIFK